MSLTLHPKYRPDIDGLRAVAVLSVVFFHGFPNLLPGGFIGVDIFFVISGYLITQIILENLENSSFQYREFYARRIRRIFPALIIVLIFCHVVGWFLMMPSEYQQLGKHIAASSIFSSNFLLWQESGYFDSSAESKPLLHLWSLGIEEQFYILWPAILAIAYKARVNAIKPITVILLTSFIINLLLSRSNPTAAFFLPPSRFWELLIGAALACYVTQRKTYSLNSLFHSSKLKNIASILGLILILMSLCFINRNSLFPGWWALLPTLGTSLLIGAGSQTWVNQKILAHRTLVWFGLISFPLYLWHWPIFTLYRLYSLNEISPAIYLILISLSIFLAWGTYYVVESRFRHDSKRWKLLILIIGMAGIGFIGWNCYNREGMPFRAIAQKKFNFYIQDANGKTHCFNQINQNNQVTCDKSLAESHKDRLVILWGDSHASHLNAGLISRLKKDNIALLDNSLPACPPVLNFLPRQERSDATAANLECQNNNLETIKEIELYKPRTVILAANWLQYDGVNQFNLLNIQNIGETIQALKKLGIKNIILIGNFPNFYVEQPRLAAALFRPNVNNRTLQRLNMESIQINESLANLAKENNISFASPSDLLCNPEGCLLSSSPSTLLPIGIDGTHLSKTGSIYVIEQLRSNHLITLQ